MPRPNMTNDSFRNSEAVTNLFLRESRTTESEYFYRLRIGEFAAGMPLPQVRAQLLRLVSIVVGSCAKKEVVGIHARWVVALVKDAQLFWDWAFVQNPGSAMCGNQFSSGKQYGSVAVKRLARSPFPATRLHDYIAAFKSRFQAPVHNALLFYLDTGVN